MTSTEDVVVSLPEISENLAVSDDNAMVRDHGTSQPPPDPPHQNAKLPSNAVCAKHACAYQLGGPLAGTPPGG